MAKSKLEDLRRRLDNCLRTEELGDTEDEHGHFYILFVEWVTIVESRFVSVAWGLFYYPGSTVPCPNQTPSVADIFFVNGDILNGTRAIRLMCCGELLTEELT